jgi:hypothetical protein
MPSSSHASLRNSGSVGRKDEEPARSEDLTGSWVTPERRWKRALQRFEVRKLFIPAEAWMPALMMLACPSRLGTDTPLSRTVGPHPVGRSSSSLDLRCSPFGLLHRCSDPWGLPVPDLPGARD